MVNNFPKPDPLKCFNWISVIDHMRLPVSNLMSSKEDMRLLTGNRKKMKNMDQTVQNEKMFNKNHHTISISLRHISDWAKQLSIVDKIIQVRSIESCKD